MDNASDSNRLTKINRSITDNGKILDAVFVSLFFLSIAWSLFVMDEYMGFHLKSHGLQPRTWEGLWGILSMHFLHGNLEHIWHNTLAFLVLNGFLFYFYRPIAPKLFFSLFFGATLLLWLIGRPSNHIGASLLIYGEFSFLFVSGVIRNHPLMMRVALAVAFFYGSLVWYIFPVDQNISWEGHLSGFIVGTFMAVYCRNQGPKRPVYRFEQEREDENAYPYWMTPEQLEKWKAEQEAKRPISTTDQTTVTIKYDFKEKGKN